MFSNIFVDRVTIQTKTQTKTPTGRTNIWTTSRTAWASVIEMNVKIVDYSQNESQKKLIKVTLRGRLEIDVANTRFLWKNGAVLEPISSAFLGSRSDTQLTVLYCHKIDGLT